MAFDLDAYFERVRYQGSRAPTLATLHALTAAHTHAIPFENLDVLLGRPIDLDPEAIFHKLVRRRRGGYCFEQNALFSSALTALGFQVRPCSGRGRIFPPRGQTPPRTHLFLTVDLDGQRWLTDVGVGGLSLTSALRLDTDLEQPTPHEARRIVSEGDHWLHQARLGDAWTDVYEFTGEEMPPIDREVGNWFTSTHPRSHFRDRLIVARARPDGRRVTLLNDELKLRECDGRAATHKLDSAEALLAALAEHFELHFPAGTRFGAPWQT